MQSLGVIASLILLLSTLILVTKWPASLNKTISEHAAAKKDAYIFYTICQVFAGILFAIFMFGWFIPHAWLPASFSVIFIAVITLQIATALIPDPSIVHRVLARGLTIGLLLLIFIIGISPHTQDFIKVLALSTSIYMLISYCAVEFFKKPRKIVLILQSFYYFLFLATIISATYLK